MEGAVVSHEKIFSKEYKRTRADRKSVNQRIVGKV